MIKQTIDHSGPLQFKRQLGDLQCSYDRKIYSFICLGEMFVYVLRMFHDRVPNSAHCPAKGPSVYRINATILRATAVVVCPNEKPERGRHMLNGKYWIAEDEDKEGTAAANKERFETRPPPLINSPDLAVPTFRPR